VATSEFLSFLSHPEPTAVDFPPGFGYTAYQGGIVESRLALYLLGPPRIELDDAPITLGRRKAVALLAFLAVAGERHRRDSLVNLLWPDNDTARGRSALRRTLYALKKSLGGEFLEVDRSTVGMRFGDDVWVDVVIFRQQLAECETHDHPLTQVCPDCVTLLSEAVKLCRGEFLSGFGLKDSFNFDDWQLIQSEALHRELASALARLIDWHTSRHEFDPALAFARHKLAQDPLDEEAHRALMRLYAWSGQRAAALVQYEECVAVLQDELGVPPQTATNELFAAIQEGLSPSLPDADAETSALGQPETEHISLPTFLEGDVPVERPIFVAREAELAQLDRHLEAALAGQGQVVFVTGDAGSGKTALIQEFAHRAEEDHPELLSAGGHGNAQTGVGDPYLPFREILGLLTGDVEAQWAAGAMTREQARRLWQSLPLAAQALVEVGADLIDTFVGRRALLKRAAACGPGKPAWLSRLAERREFRLEIEPGVAAAHQSHLFEQYTRVLHTLAHGRPLLLMVDDLQWADLGSVSLLFHLGRHLIGSRILIVGAYRPEEVALGRPDPVMGAGQKERHPLEPVISEFQREFGDITVELGSAESREFVDALLDSEPNRLGVAFREMLLRQTQGHPLFTVELLRGLQEQGNLLRDSDGRWVEGPALDWGTLPARVEAVVAERVNRLAQPLRANLRVASVEGEVFTTEVLAQVRGIAEEEAVRCLSRDLDRKHRLVRARGIQWIDGQRVSQYRFRHILFQRYLYNSLDEVERAYLHAAVGNKLEALYQGQAEAKAAIAGQLAWHFQEAGISAKAIGYLHQAGDRAVRLCAYQEGIAHLSRALELLLTLPASPERDQQELALQLSLGMGWLGVPPPEREKAHTRARELSLQTGHTSQLLQIAGQLAILHYVRAENKRARELAEEALDVGLRAGDPLSEAVGHWYMGCVLFSLGDFPAARAHFVQMISFYKPQEHHGKFLGIHGSDAGAGALAYDACCLWALGYPERGLERSQEALTLARELAHAFTLADVLCYGGCVFNRMRQEAPALKETAEELIRLARDMAFPSWLGSGTYYRGEALARLGEIQTGIAQMHEGIAAVEALGVRILRTGVMCALAEAEANAGNPRQGLDTLAEAHDLVEETGERLWEAELYRVQADLRRMLGQDAAAEASLQTAIDVARRQAAKSWELRATTGLARLWQEQGKFEEAYRMLSAIFDWFTEGFDTPDLLEARVLLDELSRA
jgi:DNA-binding SARP family transcriptional activator